MRFVKAFVCAFAVLIVTALACSASAAEVGTVLPDNGLRLRAEASTSANTLAVVEHGAQVVILEYGDEWCKVNYAGTEGYMASEYLAHAESAFFAVALRGKVTASVVNLRSEPNTESETLMQLSEGTEVSIVGATGGWYHIRMGETVGFIHPDYVYALTAYLPSQMTTAEVAAATSNLTSTRAQVIEYAKQYIGTRYTYGGRSPSSGFDCSGFVYYVFKNFGYTLNPGASSQMDSVKVIKRAELVPGDLVFFNNGTARRASHVGIYVGDGQFIHAVSPGKSLTISDMTSGYYSNYFVGGGRVLPLSE